MGGGTPNGLGRDERAWGDFPAAADTIGAAPHCGLDRELATGDLT